jgi:hypothetical protein
MKDQKKIRLGLIGVGNWALFAHVRVLKVGSTRRELDCWMETLSQPWSVAMEATIFSGWIYDHLLPHAAQIKVAHPLMLRAIAAAKKKNDQIDASKIADRSAT